MVYRMHLPWRARLMKVQVHPRGQKHLFDALLKLVIAATLAVWVFKRFSPHNYILTDGDIHVSARGPGIDTEGAQVALVVVCFNRPDYLKRTLDSMFDQQRLPSWSVFVSQDGNHTGVTEVIQSYKQKFGLKHIRFDYDEGTWTNRTSASHPRFDPRWRVYYRISAHYYYFLHEIFSVNHFDRAIIIEDDMELAVDFADYFKAAMPLLDHDPNLLCISAWNDNGKPSLASDPRTLYRTDCFPGLGWAMSRSLWLELEARWPLSFWDDWLRQHHIRRGRTCIYPEVNRVYTFGKEGSSNGQFFDEYLSKIQLNSEAIDWEKFDWSSMLEPNYKGWVWERVRTANVVTGSISELEKLMVDKSKEVVLWIDKGRIAFENVAARLGLMKDFREGIARTSYYGVVPFRKNETRVWLVPEALKDEILKVNNGMMRDGTSR